ncbi:MAG: serine hydrolase [Oligoflexia bacterium]|nr:serine hydrolase [Oligoflexia bacterium]
MCNRNARSKIKILFWCLLIVFSAGSRADASFSHLPNTPECADFEREILRSSPKSELKTETFAVATGDSLFFEWYGDFFTKDSKQCLWSGSKTIIAILVGHAILQGKLTLETMIGDVVPQNELLNPDFSRFTVRELLNMVSGISWNESRGDDLRDSSLMDMLYVSSFHDSASYVQRQPMRKDRRWNYSSGDFVLLTVMLENVYKDNPRYPWELLFDRVGIKNVTFERDSTGTYWGGSHLFLTTRDMIKIGQLLLNRGVWNGERILPDWWVDFMTTVSPGILEFSTEELTNQGVYGAGIWTNRSVNNSIPFVPNMPQSTFFASGLSGQYIIVSPEQNLIIVRTANDKINSRKMSYVIDKTLGCFKNGGSDSGINTGLTTGLDTEKGTYVDHPTPKRSYSKQEMLYAIKSGLLSNMLAKELCSCHYVTGLPFSECRKRTQLPSIVSKIVKVLSITDYSMGKGHPIFKIKIAPTVLSYLSVITKSPKAVANYDPLHPELGCMLE